MARDWRRLALAALAAAAVGLTCVVQCRCAGACQDARQEGQGQSQGARGRGGRRAARTPPRRRPPRRRPGPGRGPARHRGGAEAARGRQGRAGGAGAERGASGGNLPPAIMAKALFYRGIAYRQQKQARAGHRRPDERAVAEGRARRQRSRRRPAPAHLRLPGGGAGRRRRGRRPRGHPRRLARPDADRVGGAGLGQRGEPIRAGSAEAIGRLESCSPAGSAAHRRRLRSQSAPHRKPRRADHRLHRPSSAPDAGRNPRPGRAQRLVAQHRGAQQRTRATPRGRAPRRVRP